MSCYNDDIQGTGGVTLAGSINSLKITGSQLKEQRILFLGAGSAAIGLADLIVAAQVQQGVPADAARQRIRMFDTQGLVVAGVLASLHISCLTRTSCHRANPSTIWRSRPSTHRSSRPSKISDRPR